MSNPDPSTTSNPLDHPQESSPAHRACYALPAVGGRRLPCSNGEFERRCLVMLAAEQAKLNPDNALVALLCDAVRLAREYTDCVMGSVVGVFRRWEGEEGHNDPSSPTGASQPEPSTRKL